jgi:hypothetical protein
MKNITSKVFLQTIQDCLEIEIIEHFYFFILIYLHGIQIINILIHQNLLFKYLTNYLNDLINFSNLLKKIDNFYFDSIFNLQPNFYSYFTFDDLYII